MVAMFFGMSRSLGALEPPWSWITNTTLLAQFPITHSFLLSKKGRALLAHLAPVGIGVTLSSTTYATIASLQVFALFALWSANGTIWWQAHGAALGVMTVLYAGSWLLLGKAMSDAGLGLQTGNLGWVALWRNKRPIYPKMPESGLFRLSRQPIYVAFTLTLWTVPMWTPDQLIVAIVLTSYCLIGPLFKEARFRRIYGSAFDAYARVVPYWLPWHGKKAPTSRRGESSRWSRPDRDPMPAQTGQNRSVMIGRSPGSWSELPQRLVRQRAECAQPAQHLKAAEPTPRAAADHRPMSGPSVRNPLRESRVRSRGLG
jgi:methanethiol S-methyltransferase